MCIEVRCRLPSYNLLFLYHQDIQMQDTKNKNNTKG